MVGAPARRQQVAYAKARGLSERRACALISVARSTLHYESKLAVRDAPVLAAMSILSAQYPRYGYRRIPIFLGRQGHKMSADRAWRLWRLTGLQRATQAPTQACVASASPAATGDGGAARLGVRLRIRRVCERPATEVPDRDR